MDFYGSANRVKALKEVVVRKIGLQSQQVYLIMLQ